MTLRIESHPFAVTGESLTILCSPSSRFRVDGMPSRIQRATWSRHATMSAVRSSSTRRRPKTGITSRVEDVSPALAALRGRELSLSDLCLEQRRCVFAPERQRPHLPLDAIVSLESKLVPGPDGVPDGHGQPAEARARIVRIGGPCAGPLLEPERSSRRPSVARSPGATSAPSRSASASPIGSSPRRKASRSSRLHVKAPVVPRRPTGYTLPRRKALSRPRRLPNPQ